MIVDKLLYKLLKAIASIPTDDLVFSPIGVEIITVLNSRSPLIELIFTRAVSALR